LSGALHAVFFFQTVLTQIRAPIGVLGSGYWVELFENLKRIFGFSQQN